MNKTCSYFKLEFQQHFIKNVSMSAGKHLHTSFLEKTGKDIFARDIIGLLTFLLDTENGFWHCWQFFTALSSAHCASFKACWTSFISSYFNLDLKFEAKFERHLGISLHEKNFKATSFPCIGYKMFNIIPLLHRMHCDSYLLQAW